MIEENEEDYGFERTIFVAGPICAGISLLPL